MAMLLILLSDFDYFLITFVIRPSTNIDLNEVRAADAVLARASIARERTSSVSEICALAMAVLGSIVELVSPSEWDTVTVPAAMLILALIIL